MSALRRFLLARKNDRELCRSLTLEGWDLLTTATDSEQRLVLIADPTGFWQLAIPVIGLYLGPLDVAATSSHLRTVPGRWRRRFVERAGEPAGTAEEARAALTRSHRTLIVGSPGAWIAAASRDPEVTVFRVRGEHVSGGRYRLTTYPAPSTSSD